VALFRRIDTTRARRPTMTADLWLELVVVIVRIIAAGLAR
jgi:hypothetical protein